MSDLRTVRDQLRAETAKLQPLIDGEPAPPQPSLDEVIDAVAEAVAAEYRQATT